MGGALGGWAQWVATGFGIGYAPAAPGTAGSVLGLLLYLLVLRRASPALYASVLLGILILGGYTAGRTEQALGKTDPRQVVIDEILGMLLTYFLLPVGLIGGALGFMFFRLFDILKPPPLRWLQKRPGGAGIMLDDIGAAVYAHLLTRWVLAWLR